MYAGLEANLNHVAAALHELDQDGTTARLWRTLYRRWPLIGKLYAECYRSPSADRRPCYARDHTWLKWSNEGMKPAAIRNRWNLEHPREKIGLGESGRDLVKKGINTARREQESE